MVTVYKNCRVCERQYQSIEPEPGMVAFVYPGQGLCFDCQDAAVVWAAKQAYFAKNAYLIDCSLIAEMIGPDAPTLAPELPEEDTPIIREASR